jgi:hypothetical protein
VLFVALCVKLLFFFFTPRHEEGKVHEGGFLPGES